MALRGFVGGRYVSLKRSDRDATILRCSRLGSQIPGPMIFSTLCCILSRREVLEPIHTNEQYSIRGRTNPLYTVVRALASRRGGDLGKEVEPLSNFGCNGVELS